MLPAAQRMPAHHRGQPPHLCGAPPLPLPAAAAAAAAAARARRRCSSRPGHRVGGGLTAAAAPAQSAPGSSSSSSDQWQAVVLDRALQPGQLVRLTLKGRIKGDTGLAVVRPSAGGGAEGASSSSSSNGAQQPLEQQQEMPYKQLTLRPVLIRGTQMLQLSLFTARQDITKNHTGEQAATELAALLRLPWQSAALVTLTESVTVQVSRKGKALVQVKMQAPAAAPAPAPGANGSSSSSSSRPGAAPTPQQVVELPSAFLGTASSGQQQQQQLISLQHDRFKAQPINGSVADPFLQKIGLQTAEGRIRANMQAKFTQVNEFLKLLSHSGQLDKLAAAAAAGSGAGGGPGGSSGSRPVHVVDAGCGSSHLTFGTWHYLHTVLGLPVRLTGIDTNQALMERSNRACADLGIADSAHFHTAAIRDLPALGLPSPDIILALHACDTATDEALAVGVASGAGIIMSVPCCQKDIQRQFSKQQQQQQGKQQRGVQGVLEPLLSHGILRQRQLDLLTDTFRAALLRLAGYRTDVVEFVSTEHTPRNLLIRGVRAQQRLAAPDALRLAQQYVDLRDAWGVAPRLEALLLEAGALPEAVARQLTRQQQPQKRR